MKNISAFKRFLCLICFGLLSFGAYSQASDSLQKPKTYAVIIGISAYKNSSIPRLKYAHKDAESLYNHLQSPLGGNTPVDQITFLINEKANIAAIYQAFDWLKESAGENDRVYIYFAGHGDIETENQKTKGYLLAYNSPPNNYSNNTISIEDLNGSANYLSITKKAKVVLITDACHSGKLAGDFFKGKQFANEQLQLVMNNEIRMASCKADEEAAENMLWGNGRGVFSYYLINGLEGFADAESDGDIDLKELKDFLKNSFKEDKVLTQLNHKQNPVIDGNDFFVLRKHSPEILRRQVTPSNEQQATDLPEGFASLQKAQPQPLDYFFDIIEKQKIETIIPFKELVELGSHEFPLAFMSFFPPSEGFENDTLSFDAYLKKYYYPRIIDYSYFRNKLNYTLTDQVKKSPSIRRQMNRRFVQHCHNKAQDLINAYLQGDLKELEKRQYYSDKQGYYDFLDMLLVAKNLTPEDRFLSELLEVNYNYLNGLVARLQLVNGINSDSLMQVALASQHKTLDLDQFAAYAHNELGNLYLYEEKLDSAEYHLEMASMLAPSWAIPWSNKIALYYFTKNCDKAREAIHIADSLQPGLSFVQVNAGRVMEEINLLSAETYYLKAIRTNQNHFLPYERLGYIFSESGRFQLADRFYQQADTLKKGFTFPPLELMFVPATKTVSIYTDTTKSLSCNYNTGLADFDAFINIVSSDLSADAKAERLKNIVDARKDVPLSYHYLAKELYKLGEIAEAEQYFNLAISNFETKDELIDHLKSEFFSSNLSQEEVCFLKHFERLAYEIIEDHNFLSDIYEKLNEQEKAIEQYLEIIKIDSINYLLRERYEPIGTLRLARYYARIEKIQEAETLLVEAIASKKLPDYYSYELKNFYHSLTIRFPRDFIWYEKYGMLLYNQEARFLYETPNIDYHSIDSNYLSFVNPPDPKVVSQNLNWEKDFLIKGLEIFFSLEERDIEAPEESLKNLLRSVELSGDLIPKVEIQEAIATLSMILKDYAKAAKYYKEVLKIKNSPEARANLVNALMLDFELVKATEQIKLQSELDNNKKIYVIYNSILSKDFAFAKNILSSIETNNYEEAEFKLKTAILLETQRENWKKAEKLVEDYQITFVQNENSKAFVLYNLALINAKRKKRKAALKYMQVAEKTGKSYPSLMANNPTLKPIWERR